VPSRVLLWRKLSCSVPVPCGLLLPCRQHIACNVSCWNLFRGAGCGQPVHLPDVRERILLPIWSSHATGLRDGLLVPYRQLQHVFLLGLLSWRQRVVRELHMGQLLRQRLLGLGDGVPRGFVLPEQHVSSDPLPCWCLLPRQQLLPDVLSGR
jgi:hypothetical protein